MNIMQVLPNLSETTENVQKKGIYLSEELADTVKDIFGLKYEKRTANTIKAQLSNDYYASNILRILLVLSKSRSSYTDLLVGTQFRNEHKLVKYLRWMTERSWIRKNEDGIYEITDKGQIFLDAF